MKLTVYKRKSTIFDIDDSTLYFCVAALDSNLEDYQFACGWNDLRRDYYTHVNVPLDRIARQEFNNHSSNNLHPAGPDECSIFKFRHDDERELSNLIRGIPSYFNHYIIIGSSSRNMDENLKILISTKHYLELKSRLQLLFHELKTIVPL